MNVRIKRSMVFALLSFIISGCAHALFGTNPIGKYEPFNKHINQHQILQVPMLLVYAEGSPIVGFWSYKTYREGEMYNLTDMRYGEVAFELKPGTPIKIQKVVYHTNMSGSKIVAFGEVYVADIDKNVPFFYCYKYSCEGKDYFLERAPWESMDISEKRIMRLGILANQYFGLKE